MLLSQCLSSTSVSASNNFCWANVSPRTASFPFKELSSVCTTLKSRSLFSLDTDLRRVETTEFSVLSRTSFPNAKTDSRTLGTVVSWSTSAASFLEPVWLATQSLSATSFLELVKVGTVLAAAWCCGMSRQVKVLRSGDCCVSLQLEGAVIGRKIDRRALATAADAADGMAFDKHTENGSNTLGQWIVRSVARNEKAVRMRPYGEVSSVHPVASVWKRNLFRKKNTAAERARLQEGIRTHVDFGNSPNSIRPQQVSLSQSEHESVVVRSYHLSHHFWSCHWKLHHVELSVNVEDEDDEKCCCQLKLNLSKCYWTKIQCVVLSCPQV